MRRQRNMAQVKGQIKTPEKELNEMEISSPSDDEFKILVLGCSRNLVRTSISIKKIQSETKNTLI